MNEVSLASDYWTISYNVSVSVGGDTDTLICITGSIAEAFYMEQAGKGETCFEISA